MGLRLAGNLPRMLHRAATETPEIDSDTTYLLKLLIFGVPDGI